jgi:hypothetical protein
VDDLNERVTEEIREQVEKLTAVLYERFDDPMIAALLRDVQTRHDDLQHVLFMVGRAARHWERLLRKRGASAKTVNLPRD